MEVGATALAVSHDMVAGFVSTQATEARVGVVRLDSVSNSADGWPAFEESLDPVIAVVKLLEARAVLTMRRVTRSAGIGSANRSALGLGVPMWTVKHVGCSDGLKRWV
jgi:hypothetical protein